MWSNRERQFLKSLTIPDKIQSYLDSLPYSASDITRSARFVLKAKTAHCFDGAIFAAAALEQNGFKPLLMDLRATENDDDHVLAIFRLRKGWGAIGKSNYANCRYREPVYRTLRELALSYFNTYFNLAAERTLREYSIPYNLSKETEFDWRFNEGDVSDLGAKLDSIRHYHLITSTQAKNLNFADKRLFQAETLGINPKGAFKIKGAKLNWLVR